ncbi:MAG: transposase [Bacteroidia bacterium]|nr:transposase [Bacteroidia bacterium]
MSKHSIHRIHFFVTFAVNNHSNLIRSAVSKRLYACIKSELRSLGCTCIAIGGMADHIHILYSQNPTKAPADIIKHIKGHSSHFINGLNLIPEHFSWQKGYGMLSIHSDNIPQYTAQINNQNLYHKNKTFLQENEEAFAINYILNKAS